MYSYQYSSLSVDEVLCNGNTMGTLFRMLFKSTIILWYSIFNLIGEETSSARALTINTKGNGLSSLHKVRNTDNLNSTTRTLFGGTKRGLVLQYRLDDVDKSVVLIKEYQTPVFNRFPIYSMISRETNNGITELFCAGGDRYISVWQLSTNNLEFKQRLGPHTGWVKDVALDSQRGLLYSIGCNCIETWGLTETMEKECYHVSTRSVKSSPQEGSTLSSDVLCMAMQGDESCLYVGGVDGRIHVWSSDVSIQHPLQSVSASDGRINVLILAKLSRLLFSTGHGGYVQCRMVSDGGLISSQECGSIKLVSSTGSKVRVTAATMIAENHMGAIIVLGTSAGGLHLIKAIIDADEVALTEDHSIKMPEIGTNSQINSIVRIGDVDSTQCSLLVGHSTGMEKIDIVIYR